MKRLLALTALALIGLGTARTAHAQGKSYCVGGFALDNGSVVRDECRALGSQHKEWHFHTFVKGPDGQCYACWDEQDMTCQTVMPIKEHFIVLNGEAECERIGPAEPRTGLRIYVADPNSVPRVTPPKIPDPDPDLTVTPPSVPTPQPPAQAPDPGTGNLPKPQPRPSAPSRPRPPPAKIVALKAEVVLSPGPYAKGDKLQVTGRVTTVPGGQPRQVLGGTIVLLGPGGVEKARVVGTPAGGTVKAELTLPDAGDYTVRFEPGAIDLPASEKKGTVDPVPTALTASACRLRGVVLSPGADEILVASQPMTLRGEIRNAAGKAVTPGDLGGAKAVFTLDYASGKQDKLDAQVDASGVATAKLTPPAPDDGTDVLTVRLLGEGGGNDFCPDAPVTARVTTMGLGMDITTPKTCYVDRPCAIGMSFRLPEAPDARSAGQAFISAPDLSVKLLVQQLDRGAMTAGGPGFAGTMTPDRDIDTEVEVVATAGGKEVSEKHPLHVKQPIVLELPPLIDLGTVAAGTGAAKTCRMVDFSASRGVEDEELHLQISEPQGCRSRPVLLAGDGQLYPLTKGVTFKLGLDRKVPVCLAEVPRCSAESPEPVTLTVKAVNPDFPDQVKTAQLKWRVTGRSLLACYLIYLVIAAGVISFLFLVYGFIRPYNFSIHDQVKIAAQQAQLNRAVARRLKELPGGRSGFYRSAATGLREDGSATRKLGTASVILRARRGEVVLESRGGLQRVNPQSKKLEPVDTKDGHLASKNVVYNVGSLFFQVT